MSQGSSARMQRVVSLKNNRFLTAFRQMMGINFENSPQHFLSDPSKLKVSGHPNILFDTVQPLQMIRDDL
jgi:hypothetical protein